MMERPRPFSLRRGPSVCIPAWWRSRKGNAEGACVQARKQGPAGWAHCSATIALMGANPVLPELPEPLPKVVPLT